MILEISSALMFMCVLRCSRVRRSWLC